MHIAVAGEAGPGPADRARLVEFLGEVRERGGSAWAVVELWAQARAPRLVELYQVVQSPTFILVDGKGVIVGVWQGKAEVKKLAQEVRTKLASTKDQ